MFGFVYFIHTLIQHYVVRYTLLWSCHRNSEQDLRTALALYKRTHICRHSTHGGRILRRSKPAGQCTVPTVVIKKYRNMQACHTNYVQPTLLAYVYRHIVNALIDGIVKPVRTDALERRIQRTYANLLPGAHTA